MPGDFDFVSARKPSAVRLATLVPEAKGTAAPFFFEEVGEGCLFVGGCGQGTDPLRGCPIAKRNAPTRKDRIDTAYISKLDGLPLFQWYGRKSDGCFHPIGKILRLTRAGFEALKVAAATATKFEQPYIARMIEAISKHDHRFEKAGA